MARDTLGRVKRLLTARDGEAVWQGVELVRALADPALYAALLEGARFEPGAHVPARTERLRQPLGRLRPGPALRGTGPDEPFRELALLGLLAHAPEHAALRAAVTDLCVGSDAAGPPTLPAPPLEWLAALPALRRLQLVHRGALALGALAACPALVELEVHCTEARVDGLGASRSLAWLAIRGELDDTAGLAGAPLAALLLDGGSRPTRVDGLAHAPLERLEVPDRTAELAGLATSATLVHVEVGDAMGLDTWPRTHPVHRLVLRAAGDRAIPALDHLQRLRVRAPGQRLALGALPALARLELDGAVLTAPLAESCPALRALHYANAAELEALRGASVAELALRDVRAADLSPLSSLRGLARLELCELHAVRAIPPLPDGAAPGAWRWAEGGMVPTTAVALHAPHLEEVGGLAGLVGLRRVELSGCPALVSVRGLEASPTLRVVDVRGCAHLSDVACLAEAPELRAVFVRGSGAAGARPSGFAGLWSTAASPDLDAAEARPKPSAGARARKLPVPEPLRALWEQAVPRLATASKAVADAAIDALLASDDPALFDALLAKTRAPLKLGGPLHRVHGDRLKVHVFQRLVGEGPAASARVAHLRRPTRLWVSGAHGADGAMAADVRGIGAFSPSEVHLRCAHGLDGVDHLDELARVDVLVLERTGEADCARLSVLTGCRSLRVDGARLDSLRGLEALPALRELVVRGRLGELSTLAALPVERLSLHRPAPLPAAALPRGLRALRTRKLAEPEALPEGLVHLDVERAAGHLHALRWLFAEAIDRLEVPALRGAWLRPGGAPLSLACLPAGLTHLSLYGYRGDFAELAAERLELLELHGRLPELGALAHFAHLHTLRVDAHAHPGPIDALVAARFEVLELGTHRRRDLGWLADHPTCRLVRGPSYVRELLGDLPVPFEEGRTAWPEPRLPW